MALLVQNHTDGNKVHKKNLFVVSMYFFIPLEKLSKEYIDKIQNTKDEIKAPDYIQNAGFVCKYLDLSKSESISDQEFIYKSLDPENGESISRKINLHPFLFQFYPDKTQRKGIPFLVVRTSINKKFTDLPTSADTFTSDLCTEHDIIMLRQSLLKPNGQGAYFHRDNKKNNHREWLENIVNLIEESPINEDRKKHISFFNSITDICTTSIDKEQVNNYEEAFTNEYYCANINNIRITNDDRRFCYGILTGNENYMRVPKTELDAILKEGYSNNITEHTFAVPKSIVFIKKHHPFPNASRISVMPESLCFIQYIHEMCGCLYIDRQLKQTRQLFRSKESAKIKSALSSLAETLGTKLFRITEADHRAEYIYSAFGLRDEYERLKERGNLLADALNIKYSRRNNLVLIALTILTILIGLLQIILK